MTTYLKKKKIKTMIDFDKNECNSIKLIIVKGDANNDVTSRFTKGKMLMFAKLSIKSFVYDMIDVSVSQMTKFNKFMIIIRLKDVSYIRI